MKVTRDKTLSIDLGNGLRLEKNDGCIRMCFTSSKDSQWVYTHSLSFCINEWAEEILASTFTPVHITLETEDEACTLWNLLNVNATDINKNEMFLSLHSVYRPEDAQ